MNHFVPTFIFVLMVQPDRLEKSGLGRVMDGLLAHTYLTSTSYILILVLTDTYDHRLRETRRPVRSFSRGQTLSSFFFDVVYTTLK